jgi:hypothetical protein
MLRNAASSIMNRLHGSSNNDNLTQPHQEDTPGSSNPDAPPAVATSIDTNQPRTYEPYRAPSPPARTSYSTYNPFRPVSPSSPRTERPNHRRTSSGGYILGAAPRSPTRTSGSPGTSPSSGSNLSNSQRAPGNTAFMTSRIGNYGSGVPLERERRPQAYAISPQHERYDPRAPTSPGGSGSGRGGTPSRSDSHPRAPPGAWDENLD